MEIKPNVSSQLARKLEQMNLGSKSDKRTWQWNEFIRLLTPEDQQVFMADVWKLITLYCRRIGGD